MSWVSIIAVKT